jgi:hypothetical protein
MLDWVCQLKAAVALVGSIVKSRANPPAATAAAKSNALGLQIAGLNTSVRQSLDEVLAD